MNDIVTVAFQGWPGANSDMLVREVFPGALTFPCPSFEEALDSVREGLADKAMIPIENTLAGRVADMHHLLPHSKLHIVSEHFMPIRHQLLALPGASLGDIKEVHSHVHALGQCRKWIRNNNLRPVVHADTAGAARMVSEQGDRSIGAIATTLAADIYGLDIVATDIEDADHNVTRFVVLTRDEIIPRRDQGTVVTSFFFEVRSVPAALFKALGGFATNGINVTKLESYMMNDSFSQTQFYADVEGHPEDVGMKLAMDELRYYTRNLNIFGVYPADPFRFKWR